MEEIRTDYTRTLGNRETSQSGGLYDVVMISEYIQLGVSTQRINDLVHEYTLSHGAIPAPLNYGGTTGRAPFPDLFVLLLMMLYVTVSRPKRIFCDGDIINVDITSIYPKRMGKQGWYGIRCYILCRRTRTSCKHLVEVTRQCLD